MPSGGGLALSVPLTDGGATLAALGVPYRARLAMAAGAEPRPRALVVRVKLPPCLHHAHNSSLALASSPAATVDELIAQLAALTGMGDAEPQLAFAGVPLINGTQTLAAAGVGSGATLELCTRAPHVRVHLPEALQEAFGPTVTVAAGPTDTLAAVAALVEAEKSAAASIEALRAELSAQEGATTAAETAMESAAAAHMEEVASLKAECGEAASEVAAIMGIICRSKDGKWMDLDLFQDFMITST